VSLMARAAMLIAKAASSPRLTNIIAPAPSQSITQNPQDRKAGFGGRSVPIS